MMTEFIAILILTVAIAAVAWVWPRLQRRQQRNLRIVRPSAGSRATATGAVVPPAAVSSNEAARLRRELAQRMNTLRQARQSNATAGHRASHHDDDGPVIGFAETMIQEDTKA